MSSRHYSDSVKKVNRVSNRLANCLICSDLQVFGTVSGDKFFTFGSAILGTINPKTPITETWKIITILNNTMIKKQTFNLISDSKAKAEEFLETLYSVTLTIQILSNNDDSTII